MLLTKILKDIETLSKRNKAKVIILY